MTVYIVLAGGLDKYGKVLEPVMRRVEYVAAKAMNLDTVIFSSLFTLTTPPVIDAFGFPCSESISMKSAFNSLSFKR